MEINPVRFLTWLILTFENARKADELLLMNGSTWAQLWSGIIGAVIGSVLAALIALVVLKMTLAEQRKLASKAQLAQSQLADRQLEAQNASLTHQLNEQRSALNLQLEEQRREASLNREHAAIAELIAFLSTAMEAAIMGEKPKNGSFGIFVGFTTRWQLETDDNVLRTELFSWLETWQSLLKISRSPEKFGLDANAGLHLYVAGTANMMSFARDWTTANEAQRKQALKSLADFKSEMPREKVKTSSQTE